VRFGHKSDEEAHSTERLNPGAEQPIRWTSLRKTLLTIHFDACCAIGAQLVSPVSVCAIPTPSCPSVDSVNTPSSGKDRNMIPFSFRRLFGFEAKLASRLWPKARLRVEWLESRLAPATLTVGSHEQFANINAALAAANPGDTIKVDPGVYTQQVVIGKNAHGVTLNNIKLLGTNQQSIIAPTVNSQTAALLEVTGAKNVTIDGFTVTGPGNGTGSIGYGILVDGGGSATITNDHITNIRDNPISGDQNGVGIKVGGSTTGTATISHDTIDNYQKGGIVVNGIGSSANVSNNVVQGSLNNTAIPSNGIQFGFGATGNITNNTVVDNIFTGAVTDGEKPFEGSLPLGYQGVGILLYQSGKVNVSGNNASGNDIGIYVFASAAGASIQNNTTSFSHFDGLVIEETTAAIQVSHNTANNNAHDGIELVFDPTGSESGVPDSTHNHNVKVQNNTASNNGHDGISVEAGSTGNVFNNNTLRGNTGYDAQDQSTGSGTAGTGNTWKDNHGGTSTSPGLVG
jgi:parallel beta-helix repeat protein